MDSEVPFKLSWRVGLDAWLTDRQFDFLKALLLKHPNAVDEIALFETRYMHQYIPLDVYDEWMAVLARRITDL